MLPTCLRGSALIWHSTELTELEKRGLRNASVDEWSETLIEKFKERTSVALQHLQSEHYTMNDARQGRSPRSFAQNMLRHTKAAQLTSVYNQLSLAWNNLALEFRRDIPEPATTTTLSQFLGQLDFKENLWHEMARQQGRSQPQQDRRSSSLPKQSGQYASSNRQGGFSKPPFPPQSQPYYQQQSYQGFSPAYGGYNYENSFANRSYQPQQGYPNRQSNPLPTPRQPLQITSENASSSTTQSSNQPNPRYESNGAENGGFGRQSSRPNASFINRGYQGYQNRPFRPQGTAYQASESESASHDSPQNNNAASESHSQESQDPDNYYVDEEHDYYQPRQEDETEGYFASYSTGSSVSSYQCRRCHAIFLSKNELHRHLGNSGKGRRAITSSCLGYPIKEASSSPKLLVEAPASAHAASAEAQVIKSTADSSKEVDTGHAFRGYHYAMGAAKISEDSDPEQLCFDTGCSITLIDCA